MSEAKLKWWMRVLIALVVGIILGAELSARAQDRQLFGWTVTGRGGSPIICEDPILWPDLQEIECYD